MNAGIYVIGPDVVSSVVRNQVIDMPTLLDQHMSEGQLVTMFPLHEYWLDIGRMNDFEKAQLDFVESFIDD